MGEISVMQTRDWQRVVTMNHAGFSQSHLMGHAPGSARAGDLSTQKLSHPVRLFRDGVPAPFRQVYLLYGTWEGERRGINCPNRYLLATSGPVFLIEFGNLTCMQVATGIAEL